jgi:threonine/homoserine/homoserine lactone efflux protein
MISSSPPPGLWSIILLRRLAINQASHGSWTLLGQQLRRPLTSPARLRAFNLTMAALLVASLYPVLFPS